MNRVQLSAAGFYKTPKIHWDRANGRGHPFYYFAYGAAVSEVTIDTLTGEYQLDRVDILHDVGRSLNPAIDIGQIEGGFIQGMGWLTTEELKWDATGQAAHPRALDLQDPARLGCAAGVQRQARGLVDESRAGSGRSKAVGEPPFMLAISVLEALSMAVGELRRLSRAAPPRCPGNARAGADGHRADEAGEGRGMNGAGGRPSLEAFLADEADHAVPNSPPYAGPARARRAPTCLSGARACSAP
jgi:xanthine dehydrogenase molybdopterin-binding subunit B